MNKSVTNCKCVAPAAARAHAHHLSSFLSRFAASSTPCHESLSTQTGELRRTGARDHHPRLRRMPAAAYLRPSHRSPAGRRSPLLPAAADRRSRPLPARPPPNARRAEEARRCARLLAARNPDLAPGEKERVS